MGQLQDNDVVKLKELLKQTGEFIAYFELADSKMTQWRHDLEQEKKLQHYQLQEQVQRLLQELDVIQESLTQAGLARLRLSLEQAIKQGEDHLSLLQKNSNQLLTEIKTRHKDLQVFAEKNFQLLMDYTQQSLVNIDEQLAEYDVHHFRRIASESCLQIEKVAIDTMSKSAKLLKKFQWRTIALALSTSILTAFTVGLYLSNEFPWESRRQVINEREAGKALIRAWSVLTQQEKNKILSSQEAQKF